MTSEQLQSLWARTVRGAKNWSVLEGTHSADVVVVGGGFTGVSAAYHLAERGASVVLLESRTVGFGGSGRNVGLVNAGLWTPPDEVESKIGQIAGQRLNSVLATGPDVVFDLIQKNQIQCEAIRRGTLHCAHSSAGLRDLNDRHAQFLSRGTPVELLSAEETGARTGTPLYHGALWDPRAGTIQPLSYVQGLAQAAEGHGAQIFERSVASEIQENNGTWLVTTPQGSVRANFLIQATNAYGHCAAGESQLIRAHYFQFATAPLPQELRKSILPGGEGAWDTAQIMSSFRLDEVGRFIFGALGNLDGPGKLAHQTWVRRAVEKIFPTMKSVPFETCWTGRVAMTGSYLPRVESRGRTGVSIFGYSGRGIAPGTLFGRAAANWAQGCGEFPVDIVEPKREPWRYVKRLYFETGSTVSHLFRDRI